MTSGLGRLVRLGALAVSCLLALAGLVAEEPTARAWLDPISSDFVHGVDGAGMPSAPSLRHPLGADRLFRDNFARVVHGAVPTLSIAWTGAVLAVGFAVAVAAARARLRGRIVDTLLSGATTTVVSMPFLLWASALAAATDRSSRWTVTWALAMAAWPAPSRVLAVRMGTALASDYVLSARALGATEWQVWVRHVWPAVQGVAWVLLTLVAASLVLGDAALAYVGLGAPPPSPSWGRMAAEAQDNAAHAPWTLAAPVACIVLVSYAFQWVGDRLSFETGARPR